MAEERVNNGLLAQLPSAEGKVGWPWDQEVDPSRYRKDIEYPKLTVVTPSYNQGKYLEETIRSVLLHNYPNLEYFVMDGGSDDESKAIIEKYAPFIDHWESKKDRGQSHAINKGFQRATGTLLAWLNSDDLYAFDCLGKVAESYVESPVDLIYCDNIAFHSGLQREATPKGELNYWEIVYRMKYINQESSFWTKSILDKVGLIDEDVHFAMDYDLWIRLFKHGTTRYLPGHYVGIVREHDDRKSFDWEAYRNSQGEVRQKYVGKGFWPRLKTGIIYRYLQYKEKGSLKKAFMKSGLEPYLGIKGRIF